MKTNREKCIEMWEWISEQPNGTFKYEYFEAIGVNGSDIPDSECYACQEASKEDNHSCLYCPLYYKNPVCCDSQGEPFEAWDDDPTQENAKTFLYFIKENWKK